MPEPAKFRTSTEPPQDPLKRARRAAVGAWICGAASIALAWAQSRWYVFHPNYLPLCILFFGLAASTAVALTCCASPIVEGPRRFRATLLAAVAVLPAAFWANVGITAKRNWERRWVPTTLSMRLARVMGVTFMRAHADLKFGQRLESSRLVMYYRDHDPDHPEQVDHPREDLAAMDEHLARLENLLGGTIGTKVYWVRGSVLGCNCLSVHGVSLGSSWSPRRGGDAGQSRSDRHELAHAALDWFRNPDSDPPCLLHEGWAMAQSGAGSVELAQAAVASRLENPAINVCDLLAPDWYYRDSGPVYSVGVAFVDFLIRTRGAARFRRFATECRPATVEAKCREIFDLNLHDLESEFWEDVQTTIRESHTDR